MAFGLVSTGHGSFVLANGGTTGTSLNTTGGNLIVAFMPYNVSYGVTPPTLSDSFGNNYQLTAFLRSNNDCFLACYRAENATCGSGHLWDVMDPTGIGTPTGCGVLLEIVTFSGAPTSNALEFITTNFDNGTNQTTIQGANAIYPFTNGSLLVSYVENYTANNSATTIDSGMTIIDTMNYNPNFPGFACAWGVQSTAASVNPKWTWASSQSFCQVITLSFAASGSQATQKLAWDTSYTGTVPEIALYGWLANLSWSGGVVTATINGTAAGGQVTNGAATLAGMSIGSKFCVGVGTGVGNNPSGYSGYFTATVTSSTTFTYAVASNPGSPPSPIATAWFASILQTYIGGSGNAVNLTYWSRGKVTSGAAADSSHIPLDASETAACIGHVISCPSASSNLCLITDFNPSTFIASVSPTLLPYGALPAGISANFGATPGSGVAYSIAQSLHEFDIGLSGAGSADWRQDISNGVLGFGALAGGAIQLYGISDVGRGAYVHIKGVVPYNFSAQPPGTVGAGSAPLIGNSLTVNAAHTSLFLMGIDTVIENVQLYIGQLSTELALFYPATSAAPAPNVMLLRCIVLGGVGIISDHQLIFEHPASWASATLDTCVIVHTNACIATETTSTTGYQTVMKQCSFLNTAGAASTVNATVTTGATAVVLNAGPGMSAINATAQPIYVNHPSVPVGTTATVTGAGPYTLALSAATTGTMTAGDIVTLSVSIGFIPAVGAGGTALFAGNCAFLGTAQLVTTTPGDGKYTTCATELAAPSEAGLTLGINGTSAITAGYGAGTGAIDLRLPSGSSLRSGGTATGKTDLIGNSFSGEIGALAYVSVITMAALTGRIQGTVIAKASPQAIAAIQARALAAFGEHALASGKAPLQARALAAIMSSDSLHAAGILTSVAGGSLAAVSARGSLHAGASLSGRTLMAGSGQSTLSAQSNLASVAGRLMVAVGMSGLLEAGLLALGKPVNADPALLAAITRLVVMNPTYLALNAAPQRLGATRAGETVSRGADFSNAMAIGDTILSVGSATVTRRDGQNLGPHDLSITPLTAPGPWVIGNSVNWWVQSGATIAAAGPIDYIVTIAVITAAGETIIRDCYIMVEGALG